MPELHALMVTASSAVLLHGSPLPFLIRFLQGINSCPGAGGGMGWKSLMLVSGRG